MLADAGPITGMIASALGEDLVFEYAEPVGGGDINRCFKLNCGQRRFFVKTNDPTRLDMFEAEAQGLEELAQCQQLVVPAPVTWGATKDCAFLVLAYLALESPSPKCQVALGHGLAALHRIQAAQFGWSRENTIGSTAQINSWDSDWTRFFKTHRLGYQIEQIGKGAFAVALTEPGNRLLDNLDDLLVGHQPQPSLLHGDLWGGNVAQVPGGQPVIFDPAVYYGDRETDIAMTQLFGGFSAEFLAAYQDHWPLDEGFQMRKTLYNLYHVLNHVNLFGGGYVSQARTMMQSLLSEAG